MNGFYNWFNNILCYPFNSIFYPLRPISSLVIRINRVIEAVCKKIVSFYISTNTSYNAVRINPPTDLRIVVSGLEVIELVFLDAKDSPLDLFYCILILPVKVVSSTYISDLSYHSVTC